MIQLPPTGTERAGPVHVMALRWAALSTFLAMCVADVISTAEVIYESRFNIVASGLCDVFGYLAGLICSVLAINSIMVNGWRNKRSLVLIASATIANFCGTAVGVVMVERLTNH